MTPSEFVYKIIDKNINDEELKRLLIVHSRCVAEKALQVASRAGLDRDVDLQFVYDAAMLHDIGIVSCDAPSIHCHGSRPYICHGLEGAEILRREGLDESYCRVCERHTGSGLTAEEIAAAQLPLPHQDFLPETLEEKLICYADKFFSKSGDPSEEKNKERVKASMQRHGEEPMARFCELERLFSPKTNIAPGAL